MVNDKIVVFDVFQIVKEVTAIWYYSPMRFLRYRIFLNTKLYIYNKKR